MAEVAHDVRVAAEDGDVAFVNHRWGRHRITFYATDDALGFGGFQLTCGVHACLPKCTRSHKVDPQLGGQAGSLRRLKFWALLGKRDHTKAQHKEMWEGVMTAWANNRVPQMTTLDAHMANNHTLSLPEEPEPKRRRR